VIPASEFDPSMLEHCPQHSNPTLPHG
jgi:hypothetical protein